MDYPPTPHVARRARERLERRPTARLSVWRRWVGRLSGNGTESAGAGRSVGPWAWAGAMVAVLAVVLVGWRLVLPPASQPTVGGMLQAPAAAPAARSEGGRSQVQSREQAGERADHCSAGRRRNRARPAVWPRTCPAAPPIKRRRQAPAPPRGRRGRASSRRPPLPLLQPRPPQPYRPRRPPRPFRRRRLPRPGPRPAVAPAAPAARQDSLDRVTATPSVPPLPGRRRRARGVRPAGPVALGVPTAVSVSRTRDLSPRSSSLGRATRRPRRAGGAPPVRAHGSGERERTPMVPRVVSPSSGPAGQGLWQAHAGATVGRLTWSGGGVDLPTGIVAARGTRCRSGGRAWRHCSPDRP